LDILYINITRFNTKTKKLKKEKKIMNSKMKILFGVFFVFALLTPIYAGRPLTHLTNPNVFPETYNNTNLIDYIELQPISNVNQDNYSFTVHFIEGNTTPITHLRAFFADGTGEYEQFDMKEDEINSLPGSQSSITMENLDLSNLQDGTITVTVSYNNLRCGFNDRCGVRTTITKNTVAPRLEIFEKKTIRKNTDFYIRGRIADSATLTVQTLLNGVDFDVDWFSCHTSNPNDSPNMVSNYLDFICYFNISLVEDSDRYMIKFVAEDNTTRNIKTEDIYLSINR
jgi:hypothetical protein